MRTIRLLIEYDGAGFNGFQRQREQRTVQGELEAALSLITGEPIAVFGAGRTDTGVHAAGQVVSFTTTSTLPVAKFVRGVGGIVGEDLAVMRAQEVPETFHARYSALWREYVYRLVFSPQPSPLRRRNAHWAGPCAYDLAAIQRVWSLFLGRHDFTVWENRNSPSDDPICHVQLATIEPVGDEWRFRLRADRFLYRMVRNLVGTVLMVGNNRLDEADVRQMLAEPVRRHRVLAAPAHGLCFESVGYEVPWDAGTCNGT